MRTYFIGYDITNMYSHPVRLRWTEGGQPKTLVVPPHGSISYDSSIISSSQPDDIQVSATSQTTSEELPIYGEIPYNVRLSQYRSRHAILIGNLGKLFDFFALPCLLLGHCYINFELKH